MNKGYFVHLLVLIAVGTATLSSCSPPQKIRIRIAERASTSDQRVGFRAGAAKVDITPPPGYPMGGFSIVGKFSRGFWTRLYAKSIYLENDGIGIALVVCDLWSMPAGLADKVAELISKEPRYRCLSREQIILAATHTHFSPGNFSSVQAYNNGGSPASGFDRKLFDFLVDRIARSIMRAVDEAAPATVRIATTEIYGVSRNRSLPAFERNSAAEQNEIISQVPKSTARDLFKKFGAVASINSADAFRAIDPSLTVLRIDQKDRQNHPPIAIAAFFAMHQTAMGPATEVYHGDVFSVASTIVEQHLRHRYPTKSPIVAIFNGPEGDISPNGIRQDRRNTLTLGQGLADGILTALKDAQKRVDGKIEYRFLVLDEIKCRAVRDLHQEFDLLSLEPGAGRTAEKPYPGAATLGGAEDGRTFFYHMGLREGVTSTGWDKFHGRKIKATDDLVKKLLRIKPSNAFVKIGEFVKESIGVDRVPNRLPLGVYSMGPILFGTLPGEFTVTLGKRIQKTIGSDDNTVLLIGLANEYLSYFTTPLEYNAQHYEGASTMYGQLAGLFVEQQLARIANQPPNQRSEHVRTFVAGAGADFSLATSEKKDQRVHEQWRLIEGLENVIQDTSGRVQRNFPQFAWEDNLPASATLKAATVNPVAEIQVKKGSNWETLAVDVEALDGLGTISNTEVDTASLNFVMVIESVVDNKARWRAIWMVPALTDSSISVRFRIKTAGGKNECSEPFKVEEILGPKRIPTKSPVIPASPRC